MEDNGAGLTPEQQSNLFQPFQRLGRENSNIPGTGIGLVLCRELAHLMAGEIGFSSSAGVGSRFWIDLPGAAAPAAQVIEQAEPAAVQPQQLAEVLCVEDHPACPALTRPGLIKRAGLAGSARCRLLRRRAADAVEQIHQPVIIDTAVLA